MNNPCETCLRWEECNGVDVDICQIVKTFLGPRGTAPTFEPTGDCVSNSALSAEAGS